MNQSSSPKSQAELTVLLQSHREKQSIYHTTSVCTTVCPCHHCLKAINEGRDGLMGGGLANNANTAKKQSQLWQISGPADMHICSLSVYNLPS